MVCQSVNPIVPGDAKCENLPNCLGLGLASNCLLCKEAS